MSAEVIRIVNNLVKNEVILRMPKVTEQLYKNHDPDFIDTFLMLDPNDDEPKVFYYVSNFLGKKLAKHNELVLDIGNLYLWGSRCYGEPLENYPSLIKIAEEMYTTSYLRKNSKKIYG